MTWFRIDDGAAFHRKVLMAGNEAFGAWVRAGAWSCAPANLTEGWIPAEVAKAIATPKTWAKLVAAGLVEKPTDGRSGYIIHDFLDFNPEAGATKARMAEISEKRREAGRKGAEARWQADGKPVANAIAEKWQADGPDPDPDPDPDPEPSSPPTPRAAIDPPASPQPSKLAALWPSEGPNRSDFSTMVAKHADAGHAFAQKCAEILAAGKMPSPKQRERMWEIDREVSAADGKAMAEPPPLYRPWTPPVVTATKEESRANGKKFLEAMGVRLAPDRPASDRQVVQ